jgi:hypothetical protein
MNDLVCRNGVGQLMDYLEGVVPAHTRAALDEHVAGCAKCLAFIRSNLATPRIVREATTFDVPASLEQSLLACLHKRFPPPRDPSDET